MRNSKVLPVLSLLAVFLFEVSLRWRIVGQHHSGHDDRKPEHHPRIRHASPLHSPKEQYFPDKSQCPPFRTPFFARLKLQICPDPKQLQLLVDGALDQQAEAAVEEHLCTCESCRTQLERRIQSAESWQQVRSSLRVSSQESDIDESPHGDVLTMPRLFTGVGSSTVTFTPWQTVASRGVDRP